MTVSLDELLTRLEAVKKAGNGFVARCPAHQDRSPSLTVGEGTDGRILMKCQAGCETPDICARLNLTMADLMPEKPSGNGSGKLDIIATYDYSDEHGKLLYQVCRLSPKSFRQRRPQGEGWTWKLGDVTRVLYRLREVLDQADRGGVVYVVEGEKDVAAVEQAGGVATCNSGGAGKWRDEYSAALKGAQVVVVADNDEPGRKHAAQVAASLKDVAASVAVVSAAVGKDAADHLAAGKTLEQFVKEGDPTPSVFIDWPEFWTTDFGKTEWLYDEVLARGRAHVIYAAHKEGKSLFCLSVAAKLATGDEPVVCVYLDYEMTPADLRERLDDMGYGPGSDFSRLRYWLLPMLPPLDTVAGGVELCKLISEVAAQFPDHHIVTFFDTMGRAVVGKDNDADTIRAFYNFTGLQLKRMGITWVRLDHEGKDVTRGQRGTSAKGDDVDVTWRLTKNESGITLHRDSARMAWVPERVVFSQAEDPLTYTRSTSDWPLGTGEVANILDRLKVPEDATVKVAQAALRTIDEQRRRAVVGAALRWRKARTDSGVGTAAGTARNRSEPVPGTDEETFDF